MKDGKARLAVLNSMAGDDIEHAFDRHLEWGLTVADLKDRLFGKSVERLSIGEAAKIAEAARARGLAIHTLSSSLFGGDVERGEKGFRAEYETPLANLIEVARILRPTQIRLLMAASSRRDELLDSSIYLAACHPWLYEAYREAVDRIDGAGFKVVIENEVGRCLFSRPGEIARFFDDLDRDGRVSLIWDVQNLWEMGTFPTIEVYRELAPHLAMLHVKGGRAECPGGRLKWKSSLADASWPVVEIVGAAVADGRSPVVCLNPSHGEAPAGFRADYAADLALLRREIGGVE